MKFDRSTPCTELHYQFKAVASHNSPATYEVIYLPFCRGKLRISYSVLAVRTLLEHQRIIMEITRYEDRPGLSARSFAAVNEQLDHWALGELLVDLNQRKEA
jgi:hypothetical protein